MSQEPPTKRVRKGAKSCIECRHRKIRCIRPSEGAESCQSCLARGQTCELQVQLMTTSDAIGATSRARIEHLENEVLSLWTTVHNLEAKLDSFSSQITSHHQPPPQTETAAAPQAKSRTDDSEIDSNSSVSDLTPTHPPTHLLQLFDNGVLGSHEDASATTSRDTISPHKARGTSALRSLMPSRDDMLTITAHTSSWLSLFNAFFPINNLIKTSDEMLSQYDKLQNPNADPVAIAALLISVAMTVQEAPNDTTGRAAESIRDASLFVKDVSDSVERIVISEDILAGSLDGIQTTLLFIRLQLGRARVRKTWLLLRRVIAMAELMGLPRASMAIVSHQESLTGASPVAKRGAPSSTVESWRQKTEVWEAICALDRIISMMWSLPLATASHPLPKRPIVDSQSQVSPQSYLYSLADIASRVLEQDNIYSSGRSLIELISAVSGTDQELRSLAAATPKTWRKVHWPQLSVDALLQYWHQYITVRTHLQLALRYDESQLLAFNYLACLDACQELARRYVSIRPILPAGFFASRVIDLQAFTATVFLLLSSYRTSDGPGTLPQAVDVDATTALVDQVIRMMGSAADRAGEGFTDQAAEAVRSLSSLLQQPQTAELQKITLSIPLIGRIHVSRKTYAAHTGPTQFDSPPSQQPQGPWQTTTSGDRSTPAAQEKPFTSLDLNLIDTLSYSMEIPEDFPIWPDETFASEQWLTWTE